MAKVKIKEETGDKRGGEWQKKLGRHWQSKEGGEVAKRKKQQCLARRQKVAKACMNALTAHIYADAYTDMNKYGLEPAK